MCQTRLKLSLKVNECKPLPSALDAIEGAFSRAAALVAAAGFRRMT